MVRDYVTFKGHTRKGKTQGGVRHAQATSKKPLSRHMTTFTGAPCQFVLIGFSVFYLTFSF